MKKREKKQNRLGRVLLTFGAVCLVLLLTIGLAGVMLYKSGEASFKASAEVTHLSMGENEEAVNKMKKQVAQLNSVPWQDNWLVFDDYIYEYKEDMINLVLLGIDKSGELAKETDLSDWSAGQADTIFLLSLDRQTNRVSVIAIPRNAMIEIEIYNEEKECIDTIYNQICLQYGYAGGGEHGLEKMKECVSELMCGIPVHGACALSYDAISVMIDRIGGIEVTRPQDWAVKQDSDKIMLTSKNVISYLRYRDITQLGSPTQRLNRQKDFLKKAIAKGTEECKKNPALISEIYQAILPYMNTDVTLDRAVYLAAEALNDTIDEQSFYQLTGTDRQVDYVSQSGEEVFYDDYYLDEDALEETIKDIFCQEVILDMQSR